MDSKVFWGLIIILIGVSIIINHVFKVDFPVFKVILAVVIIYFGFSLLMSSFNFSKISSGDYSNVFTNKNYQLEKVDRNLEFNSVFGSSKIDLRNTVFLEKETDLEINAVFGSVRVYLPEHMKIEVKASSAFGSVRSFDHKQDGIGDQRYSLGSELSEKRLNIEANAVFGSVTLE